MSVNQKRDKEVVNIDDDFLGTRSVKKRLLAEL